MSLNLLNCKLEVSLATDDGVSSNRDTQQVIKRNFQI